MKKFFKWLSIILLTIIGLFIALILALPVLIDPNDFKDEIVATVQQHTGRILIIEGNIQLSVFPWLGLQLGKTSLSNATGFGQQPMLQLENIRLGVKFLPLLRQELQTDQTTLEGLQVNLQRKANGTNNWEDLVTTQQTTTTSTTPTKNNTANAAPLAAFVIGGLQLKNARVTWKDQQSQQVWTVSNLDVTTGAIQWDRAFAIKLAMSAEAEHLQARGQINLATSMTLHQDQRIELQNLKLAQQLWHPQLPVSPVDLQATLAGVHVDLNKQTLKLNDLQLRNNALLIKTNANVIRLLDAPQYDAVIEIPSFNPRQLSTAFKIALPKDLPERALTKLQTHLTLKGNTNSLTMTKLDLHLDDSHLTGSAALPSFAPLKYRYQLDLDKLDVDAYQAKTSDKQVAASPAAGAAAATQLPLDLLRSLDIKGQFNIGQLKVSNLTLSKIETHMNAGNGIIRIHPLGAQLYAGKYVGDLNLNAQGPQPVLSVNEKLHSIALGPLLKDFIGDDKLHGTTDLHAKLITRGSDVADMRKQLNGSLSADMKDGYLKGIDIDYAERKLRAKLKGEPVPSKPKKPQTGFSKLEAAFNIKNGIAQTQTLNAQLPHARMQGSGDIDLIQEQLNMTLNFKFSSKVQGQAGKSYAEMDRIALPVHLRGPITQPQYDIDFDAVLKTILKDKINKQKAEAKAKYEKKLQDEKAKAKAEYEQKIKDEKQQLKDKLNKKADDFLHKLFKR